MSSPNRVTSSAAACRTSAKARASSCSRRFRFERCISSAPPPASAAMTRNGVSSPAPIPLLGADLSSKGAVPELPPSDPEPPEPDPSADASEVMPSSACSSAGAADPFSRAASRTVSTTAEFSRSSEIPYRPRGVTTRYVPCRSAPLARRCTRSAPDPASVTSLCGSAATYTGVPADSIRDWTSPSCEPRTPAAPGSTYNVSPEASAATALSSAVPAVAVGAPSSSSAAARASTRPVAPVRRVARAVIGSSGDQALVPEELADLRQGDVGRGKDGVGRNQAVVRQRPAVLTHGREQGVEGLAERVLVPGLDGRLH